MFRRKSHVLMITKPEEQIKEINNYTCYGSLADTKTVEYLS